MSLKACFQIFCLPVKNTKCSKRQGNTFFDSLTGSYIINSTFKLSLLIRDKEFFLKDPDGVTQRLYPESKTKYFITDDDTSLEFILNDKGKAKEIKIIARGTTYIAKKQ